MNNAQHNNWKERNAAFAQWLKTDNVNKVGIDAYTTQCTQWRKRFDAVALFSYWVAEYYGK